MAKSRNERRKAAKVRLAAKQERFIGRVMAARLEENRAIVRDNLSTPVARKPLTIVKGEVTGGDGYYPASNMGAFAGRSHRGYVSAASGSMSKRSTLQVMSKVTNKVSFDNYANPKGEDRSSWPVKHKEIDLG